MTTTALKVILTIQTFCAAIVALRLIRTAQGMRIVAARPDRNRSERVSVLLPVLNEEKRIEQCLRSVVELPSVEEVIVIDTGSTDGTLPIVSAAERRYAHLRVIDAGPSPDEWNGKVWGLEHGRQGVEKYPDWILTIDADVTVDPGIVDAMLQTAGEERVDLVSVAARQHVRGKLLGMIHPSMLTTLVYRFGIPGHVASNARAVQANGQCYLIRRSALDACGGFREARRSFCEDVTLARVLASNGYRTGFYEAGDLVTTEMYESASAAWSGWSRSLPTRDRFFGIWGWLKLVEVFLAQGLAVPTFAAFTVVGRLRTSRWRFAAYGLAGLRLGTLAGTRRAYAEIDWTYWLSPLVDLPVTLRIIAATRQRSYVWRGKPLIRGE